MSLREEMGKYEQITGESAEHVPIIKLGAFLDGYEKGLKTLEQQPIDKSAMMYEIYMEGVNMTGEYQGYWVRFKDIEKIVDKYIKGSEDEKK